MLGYVTDKKVVSCRAELLVEGDQEGLNGLGQDILDSWVWVDRDPSERLGVRHACSVSGTAAGDNDQERVSRGEVLETKKLCAF